MNLTSGLGAFNKDKVANKFGIQLRPKDSTQAVQRPQTPSIERRNFPSSNPFERGKTPVTTDLRTPTKLNGFPSNSKPKNVPSPSATSKTPETRRKVDHQLQTSKSTSGLLNSSMDKQQSKTSISNDNHSKSSSIPLKSKESVPSISESKLATATRRASLIPTNQVPSPSPSSVRRESRTKADEPSVSGSAPILSQPSLGSTTKSKTNAEIEHQKDQPLYRRQLSKTLENISPSTGKAKHQPEQKTTSAPSSKR